MNTPTRSTLALRFVGLLVLGGCGDSDGEADKADASSSDAGSALETDATVTEDPGRDAMSAGDDGSSDGDAETPSSSEDAGLEDNGTTGFAMPVPESHPPAEAIRVEIRPAGEAAVLPEARCGVTGSATSPDVAAFFANGDLLRQTTTQLSRCGVDDYGRTVADQQVSAAAVDVDGDTYVIGQATNRVPAYGRVGISRISPAGERSWIATIVGTSNVQVSRQESLAVVPSANAGAYLVGRAPLLVTGALALDGSAAQSGCNFIAHVSGDGTVDWIRQDAALGRDSSDLPSIAVAADEDGNAYVVRLNQLTFYDRKLELLSLSVSGELRWSMPLELTGASELTPTTKHIAVSQDGSAVYVYASTGTSQADATPARAMLLAKFSGLGVQQWVQLITLERAPEADPGSNAVWSTHFQSDDLAIGAVRGDVLYLGVPLTVEYGTDGKHEAIHSVVYAANSDGSTRWMREYRDAYARSTNPYYVPTYPIRVAALPNGELRLAASLTASSGYYALSAEGVALE